MNNTLDYNGCKIFYRCSGAGNPVMLVHGFGEDGEIWNAQQSFLQQNFKVIVPDLPGSGRSEMVDDMSIEGMAEVIKAILEQENIASCPVIGHSMGGYITPLMCGIALLLLLWIIGLKIQNRFFSKKIS